METLKDYFEKQLQNQQEIRFNIFSALHDDNDERYLHSRFIAYLLSSEANHGMGNQFLKYFVESILNIESFDFENCSVKREYKEIDILIYNQKQAIIIENKIFAVDQPRQLERYYGTIFNEGIDNKRGEIIKPDQIHIVYLALTKRYPTKFTLGRVEEILRKDEKIIPIDYLEDIQRWMSDCVSFTESKNDIFSKIINQYKELTTTLTSDLSQAVNNQEIISENIGNAWELELRNNFFTQRCKDIFKHVKWHIVANFINELEIALKNSGAIEIKKPNIDTLTKVTHQQNNNSKTKIIIRFEYKNTFLQIVNDTKGFTLGNLTDGKWDFFSEDIKDIKFYDFSKKQTFDLIKNQNRERIISKMVREIQLLYKSLDRGF